MSGYPNGCRIMRLPTPQQESPANPVPGRDQADAACLDGDAVSAVLDEPEPDWDDIDNVPRGIVMGVCTGRDLMGSTWRCCVCSLRLHLRGAWPLPLCTGRHWVALGGNWKIS